MIEVREAIASVLDCKSLAEMRDAVDKDEQVAELLAGH